MNRAFQRVGDSVTVKKEKLIYIGKLFSIVRLKHKARAIRMEREHFSNRLIECALPQFCIRIGIPTKPIATYARTGNIEDAYLLTRERAEHVVSGMCNTENACIREQLWSHVEHTGITLHKEYVGYGMVFALSACTDIRYTPKTFGQAEASGFCQVVVFLFRYMMEYVAKFLFHVGRQRITIANNGIWLQPMTDGCECRTVTTAQEWGIPKQRQWTWMRGELAIGKDYGIKGLFYIHNSQCINQR